MPVILRDDQRMNMPVEPWFLTNTVAYRQRWAKERSEREQILRWDGWWPERRILSADLDEIVTKAVSWRFTLDRYESYEDSSQRSSYHDPARPVGWMLGSRGPRRMGTASFVDIETSGRRAVVERPNAARDDRFDPITATTQSLRLLSTDRVAGPAGMQFALAADGMFVDNAPQPVRAAVLVGYVYRYRAVGIPNAPEAELFPTIEVIDRTYPPAEREHRFPIPIELDESDIESALRGDLVTRVIYLEDSTNADPVSHAGGPQRVLDVETTDDTLQTADVYGRPLAILRIGSRIPDVVEGPGAEHFLFGCPPWTSIKNVPVGKTLSDASIQFSNGIERITEAIGRERERLMKTSLERAAWSCLVFIVLAAGCRHPMSDRSSIRIARDASVPAATTSSANAALPSPCPDAECGIATPLPCPVRAEYGQPPLPCFAHGGCRSSHPRHKSRDACGLQQRLLSKHVLSTGIPTVCARGHKSPSPHVSNRLAIDNPIQLAAHYSPVVPNVGSSPLSGCNPCSTPPSTMGACTDGMIQGCYPDPVCSRPRESDPQEYLYDGGDRDPQALLRQDLSVVGLDSEDTVIRFETESGETQLQSGCRVPIYAPRFAAIRKIEPIGYSDQVVATRAALRDQVIDRATAALPPTAARLKHGPRREENVKVVDALLDRNRGVPVEKIIPALDASDAIRPAVDSQGAIASVQPNLDRIRTERAKLTRLFGRMSKR